MDISLQELSDVSGQDFFPQAASVSALLHLPDFKTFMEILF